MRPLPDYPGLPRGTRKADLEFRARSVTVRIRNLENDWVQCEVCDAAGCGTAVTVKPADLPATLAALVAHFEIADRLAVLSSAWQAEDAKDR